MEEISVGGRQFSTIVICESFIREKESVEKGFAENSIKLGGGVFVGNHNRKKNLKILFK